MKTNVEEIKQINKSFEEIEFLNFIRFYRLSHFNQFSIFEFHSFLYQVRRSKLKIHIQLIKLYPPQKSSGYTRYLRPTFLFLITVGSFYLMPGMVVKCVAMEKLIINTSSNPWLLENAQNKIFDHIFEKDDKGNRNWQLSKTGVIILGAISSTIILTIAGMYLGGGMKRNFFGNQIQAPLPTELPTIELPRLPAPSVEFWPILAENIKTELTYRDRMLNSILKSFGRRKKLQNLLNGHLPITEENIFDVICLLTKLMSHTLSMRGYIQHLLKGHIDNVPTDFLIKLALKEQVYATVLGTCIEKNPNELGFIAKYLAELLPTAEADQLNYNSYRVSGESYQQIVQYLFKEYMNKNG